MFIATHQIQTLPLVPFFPTLFACYWQKCFMAGSLGWHDIIQTWLSGCILKCLVGLQSWHATHTTNMFPAQFDCTFKLLMNCYARLILKRRFSSWNGNDLSVPMKLITCFNCFVSCPPPPCITGFCIHYGEYVKSHENGEWPSMLLQTTALPWGFHVFWLMFTFWDSPKVAFQLNCFAETWSVVCPILNQSTWMHTCSLALMKVTPCFWLL